MEKCGVQFVKCHMAGQKNRANAPGLSAKKNETFFESRQRSVSPHFSFKDQLEQVRNKFLLRNRVKIL